MTVHHIDSGISPGRTLCCRRPTRVLPLKDTFTSTERLVSCDGTRPAPDESVCDECGGRNVVWWTDSDRWNLATASLPTGRGAILCPSCFVHLWEFETGLTAVWHLVPHHIKTAGTEESSDG